MRTSDQRKLEDAATDIACLVPVLEMSMSDWYKRKDRAYNYLVRTFGSEKDKAATYADAVDRG